MELLDLHAQLVPLVYPIALISGLVGALVLLLKFRSWSTYLMTGAVGVSTFCFVSTLFPEAFQHFLTDDPTDANVLYMLVYSVLPSYANLLFFAGFLAFALKHCSTKVTDSTLM